MRHRTRVKICGITRIEDALLSEQLGADALGFVFVPASARFIKPQQAQAISVRLSAFVTPVGLFLDASEADISAAMTLIPNLLLQFHGQETPEQCERFGVPYIKAIGLGKNAPSQQQLSEYEHAQAFLFDSNEPGQLGGTGHTFDWASFESSVNRSIVLAGGLNPDNVRTGIEQIKPYAVDVSSGVEQTKGIKDAAKLRAFFAAIASADAAATEALSSSHN